jgi:hypothetical protein
VTPVPVMTDAELEAEAAAANEPEPAGPPPMTAEDAIAAGLQIEELALGEGPTVGPRSLVVVRMVGRVLNGREFIDVDADAGPLPVDRLVEGLTSGLQGMAVGGRRRLIIPPAMAYGDRPIADPAVPAGGRPLIPAGSPLVYEVELLEIQGEAGPPAPPPPANDAETPDTPDAPEVPDASDAPEAPEAPEATDAPADAPAATTPPTTPTPETTGPDGGAA